MKSFRRKIRATATIAIMAASAALFQVSTVSAARADGDTVDSCITGVEYVATGSLAGWVVSNTASDWLAGPGTISYSVTSTATTSEAYTLSDGQSGSLSLILGALKAAVQREHGISTTLYTTISRSSTWTYSTTIPSGKTGRMDVSTHGYWAKLQKIVDNPNCTSTTYSGWARAPQTFTSSTTCLFRDIWPATYWQATTGGCYAES
jgi:hypothetical protein